MSLKTAFSKKNLYALGITASLSAAFVYAVATHKEEMADSLFTKIYGYELPECKDYSRPVDFFNINGTSRFYIGCENRRYAYQYFAIGDKLGLVDVQPDPEKLGTIIKDRKPTAF